MKKSVEILGLPIISILEGKQVGIAKQLLIDKSLASVVAVAVEHPKWYQGVNVLAFSNIAKIGSSAITIMDSQALKLYNELEEYEDILTNNIKIIGTKVLTNTGSYIGVVQNYAMDTDGLVALCEILTADNTLIQIHAEERDTFTFGVDVTVVKEEAYEENTEAVAMENTAISNSEEDSFMDDMPSMEIEIATEAAVVEEPVIPVEKIVVETAPPTVEPVVVPVAKPAEPAVTVQEALSPSVAATEIKTNAKLDDKQKQFLLGKKSMKQIVGNNGVVIIEEDGEVTEAIIQTAKLSGKYMELLMSLKS